MLLDHTQLTPEPLQVLLPRAGVRVQLLPPRPDGAPEDRAQSFFLYEHFPLGYVLVTAQGGALTDIAILERERAERQALVAMHKAALSQADALAPRKARVVTIRSALAREQELGIAETLGSVMTSRGVSAPVLSGSSLTAAASCLLVTSPAPGVASCIADAKVRGVLASLQEAAPAVDEDRLSVLAFLLTTWSHSLQDGLHEVAAFVLERGFTSACQQLPAESLAYLALGLEHAARVVRLNHHPLRFTVADFVSELVEEVDLRSVQFAG